MKPYLYAAIGLAVVIGLSTLAHALYSAGQDRVYSKLKDDRITVLKDGKKIDETVLSADDDALYCMLVNCEPN